MEEKARRRMSVALFAALCAAAVVALGVSAIFVPTALAAGNDVAEEAGMAREVTSVDESATVSAEEAAAVKNEPKADADDQEIYAIFYDKPDKKSYTLVIQNGDTLDPAYPKPADDQVILLCGESDDGSCRCGSLNYLGGAYKEYTTYAKVGVDVKPHNTSAWFADFKSMKSLDLTGLDTSKVTNMSSMFSRCPSLESVDLSRFNTSGVTNMSSMFWDCSSLESVDLSHFDTSKVTDMRAMFGGCSSLESIGLLGFNTSKVANMESMFGGCSSLESVDLSHFDTSRVTDMRSMFDGCSSLKNIEFPVTFVTTWVTDMARMFCHCSSLGSLDLSKFDMTRLKNVVWMLEGCDSLSKISLPATGDIAKADLPSWVNGAPVKWRNEKGEVFDADAIPARTAGTYTAVAEDDGSNNNGSGGDNGNGDNNGGNSSPGIGSGDSNNGNGSGSNNSAPKRTVAFSEAVTLPLDATGVAMDKWDVIRDLAKRFGSREGFPTDAEGVAVTIRLGGKEVETIDPTRAGTYEVTAVYAMPDNTERVIEATYTVAEPAAKTPVKSTVKSGARLAQTGDEAPATAPLVTAALAACALAAAVTVRRRVRG